MNSLNPFSITEWNCFCQMPVSAVAAEMCCQEYCNIVVKSGSHSPEAYERVKYSIRINIITYKKNIVK